MTEVLPGASWVYEGVWSVLTGFLNVPRHPPELPGAAHVTALRPAAGYLRYLRIVFAIAGTFFGSLVVLFIVAITVARPTVGIIIAFPLILILSTVLLTAWIAIHIKYDTTWYVLSDRSIRIRRGVWIIHETTITFENVQNVVSEQGPIERLLGIANVHIETARGGGGGHPHASNGNLHTGIMEGIADAPGIRALVMERVKASRSAGLGDEHHHDARAASVTFLPAEMWSREHVEALRQIRDAIRAMRASKQDTQGA